MFNKAYILLFFTFICSKWRACKIEMRLNQHFFKFVYLVPIFSEPFLKQYNNVWSKQVLLFFVKFTFIKFFTKLLEEKIKNINKKNKQNHFFQAFQVHYFVLIWKWSNYKLLEKTSSKAFWVFVKKRKCNLKLLIKFDTNQTQSQTWKILNSKK